MSGILDFFKQAVEVIKKDAVFALPFVGFLPGPYRVPATAIIKAIPSLCAEAEEKFGPGKGNLKKDAVMVGCNLLIEEVKANGDDNVKAAMDSLREVIDQAIETHVGNVNAAAAATNKSQDKP